MNRPALLGVLLAASVGGVVAGPDPQVRGEGPVQVSPLVSPLVAGETLKVSVPGAEGGKTVIGQLTVAQAGDAGFVTAYACADGIPRGTDGSIDRSDLNYEGRVSPVWSNRLIVEADDAGDVCFHPSTPVELVVDFNAMSYDTGITSFANRRTDTRTAGVVVEADEEMRIQVPEAGGAKTVIGQLTVAGVSGRGYVTAYPCAEGMPVDGSGRAVRSDLNFDAAVSSVRSNRLIVAADDDGDICVRPSERVHVIVDVNGVADTGIQALANQRTDTRGSPPLAAGGVLRVNVPEAADSKTVIGQLTMAQASELGFVTAYPCAAGVPVDATGRIDRSDVNANGLVAPVWSNRLIVEADDAGDICFHTSTAGHLVVDVNGVSNGGITSFPNIRIDTRNGAQPGAADLPTDSAGTPIWPAYTPLPPLVGVAALTGRPAGLDITNRPITAYKIDNYRAARPHAGLIEADVAIEVQAEYVSRFIALFHSRLPDRVGPVRSARTGDIDLLAAMNRPIFGYSGANPGVSLWLASAAESGVLVDRGAQRNGCYARDAARPRPHNLFADPRCMVDEVTWAGPARPMWSVAADWQPDAASRTRRDGTFAVAMVGVSVEWTWDSGSGRYLRSQDGAPHLVEAGVEAGIEAGVEGGVEGGVMEAGVQIAADNVVEVSTVYVSSIVDERSPHAITLGSGTAVVHRDGRATDATWTRISASDPYTFRDAVTGSIIPLDVGTTFLELVRRS